MSLFSPGKKLKRVRDSWVCPQRRRGRARKVFMGYAAGVVVALIILAFFSVCPCIPHHKAVRLDASNKGRTIAIAYSIYLASDVHRLHPELLSKQRSVSEFALFLTAANPEINNAKLWFVSDDERLAGLDSLPEKGVFVGDATTPIPEQNFMTTGPKSWAVVVNIPSGLKHDDAYPIAWTRGLRGTSWIKDSPWQGKGGHIAFSNGSVCWFESTVDKETGKGIFADFKTGEPTSDIRAAIGPDARILEDM